MNEPVSIWVTLAPSLATLIVAIAGLITAYATYLKAKAANALGHANGKKIDENTNITTAVKHDVALTKSLLLDGTDKKT